MESTPTLTTAQVDLQSN